jgi:hypothetical protein
MLHHYAPVLALKGVANDTPPSYLNPVLRCKGGFATLMRKCARRGHALSTAESRGEAH